MKNLHLIELLQGSLQDSSDKRNQLKSFSKHCFLDYSMVYSSYYIKKIGWKFLQEILLKYFNFSKNLICKCFWGSFRIHIQISRTAKFSKVLNIQSKVPKVLCNDFLQALYQSLFRSQSCNLLTKVFCSMNSSWINSIFQKFFHCFVWFLFICSFFFEILP